MTPTLILAVLAVLLTAMVLRALFGFGDAMFAIPLLAALVGLERGAPMLALSGTVMAVLLLRERPSLVDGGAVLRLLLGAAAGTPLGVLVLVAVPEIWGHRMLGALMLGFGLWMLIRERRTTGEGELDRSAPTGTADAPKTTTDREAEPGRLRRWLRDLPFGLIAGVTSAAFDIAGPPLLAYAVVRRWSDDALRINLQAVFLPLGIFTIAGHGIAGLWTREVLLLAAMGLPVMLLGYVVGGRLRIRVRARFGDNAGQRLLLALIIGLGLFELVGA